MSAPIRSMTGFARVQQSTPQGEITVSLKSVNHRGLDLHFHLPSEFDPFEDAMRAVIKRSILRGHVDVRCRACATGNGAAGGLNLPLFRAYLAAFRQAAAEEGLKARARSEPNPAASGHVWRAPRSRSPTQRSKQRFSACSNRRPRRSIEFRDARRRRTRRRHSRAESRRFSEAPRRWSRSAPRPCPRFRARLQERLRDLLANSPLDPQRLAQEAALLADRSDIGEEIARLKIHSSQLDEILDAGGEVGKKLDFLLAGDEPRNQHHSLEDQRNRRARPAHHRAGAGRQSRHRKNPRAGLEPGMTPELVWSDMISVFIISAPSGSGKSTLVHRLLETVPESGLLDLLHHASAAPD